MRSTHLAKILAATLAGGAATGATACGGPTPEMFKLMRAVFGTSANTTAEVPEQMFLIGLFVDSDLDLDPQMKADLTRLGAANPRAEQLAAAASLERRKSVGCLLTGLYSPSVDVRIRCARGLANTIGNAGNNPVPVRQMLRVARKAAVYQSGSEEATLHGIYQHALAESLNKLTHTNIKLKGGQDPEGFKAAIPIWDEALSTLQAQAIAAQAAAAKPE